MESNTNNNFNESKLDCGDLTIYSHSKVVTISGKEIILTPLEFELLTYLARNKDRPISLEELLDKVWKCSDGGTMHQVRNCIKRLRKKISEMSAAANAQRYICTVRGWGYRLYIK